MDSFYWIEKLNEKIEPEIKAVKFETMQFDSGYISPDGKLYECPFACHGVISDVICKLLGYKTKDSLLELDKREWIKISRWNFYFWFIPNNNQIDTMMEYIILDEGKSFVHNGKLKLFKDFLKEIDEMER